MTTRITAQAGTDHTLRAKATIANGAYATQANVSSVTAKISYRGVLTFSDALVGSILAAFVTNDDMWQDDTNDDRTQKGYNFLWTIPAASLANSGWHTIEVTIVDTNGGTTIMTFDGPVTANLTSLGLS